MWGLRGPISNRVVAESSIVKQVRQSKVGHCWWATVVVFWHHMHGLIFPVVVYESGILGSYNRSSVWLFLWAGQFAYGSHAVFSALVFCVCCGRREQGLKLPLLTYS